MPSPVTGTIALMDDATNALILPLEVSTGLVARVERALQFTDAHAQDAGATVTQVELETSVTRRIDIVEFLRVVRFCRSAGLMMVEHEPQLDVTFMNGNVPKGHPPLVGVRISVIGRTHITEYAHHNQLEIVPLNAMRVIRKSRTRGMHALDIPGYDLRVNLRLEESSTMSSFDPRVVRASPKMFRLKKRVSFVSEDGLFRYDLTRVHTSNGTVTSVATSGLSTAAETFEVEVELRPDEAVRSARQPVDVAHGLLSHAARLVCVMVDTPVLISSQEGSAAVAALSKLTGAGFAAPQPATLGREHILPLDQLPPNAKSVLRDYTVTEKADGERHLLLVAPPHGRVYLLPRGASPASVKSTGWVHPALAGTLLDGELVQERALFAVFDVYFHRGRDVRTLPLWRERIDLMAAIADEIGGDELRVTVKKFLRGDGAEMFAACAAVLESAQVGDLPYDIDGLILTPAGPIQQRGGLPVFKWKPPEQSTIDFLVKFTRVQPTQTVMGLFCGVRSSKHVVASAKEYVLRNNALPRPATQRYVPRMFHPSPTMTVAHDAGGPRCANGDAIENLSIVECAYVDGQWRPMRVRFDKVQDMQRTQTIRANDLHVTALPVWRSIMQPVTAANICGEPLLQDSSTDAALELYYDRSDDLVHSAANMRAFHNFWIKTCRVLGTALRQARRVEESPRLLDVGCGKAGDLNKWAMLGVKEVLGLDAVVDNITNGEDGAYVRLADRIRRTGESPSYVFVALDASLPFATRQQAARAAVTAEDREVCELLWDADSKRDNKWFGFAARPFHVASLQFDIHYFFEKREKLDNLCASLSAMLAPGGLVVGTCMDGRRVHELFRSADAEVVDGRAPDGRIAWQLHRKYDDYTGDVGMTIGVYVASINRVIDEWLVDGELLKRAMLEHGFREAQVGQDEFASSLGSFEDEHASVAASAEAAAHIVKTALPSSGWLSAKAIASKRASALDMHEYERRYSFLHMWFAFVKQG